MGYKNENIKHRQGIGGKPKYSCPNCGHGLIIPKPVFMVVCSKCKKAITQDEL
jgi:DNA-directed RNA polymerase subunit RPC12/RpoP